MTSTTQAPPTICLIEYEVRDHGIHYEIYTVDEAPDSAPEAKGKKVILHPQLREFLQAGGFLDWEFNTTDHNGNHVQHSGSITYEDFIETDLTDDIIHQYLTKRGLTTLQFDPSRL